MLTGDIFKKKLQNLSGGSEFLVAYSGGVDSHVLLHLMSEWEDCRVSAVHVNHGLHKDADHWETHCQSVCDAFSIPFRAFKIDVFKKPRQSLEAIARELRYAAIETLVSKDTVLLTGHHENDQAETLFLQLMRGAGVKGLSAMPVCKVFGKGQLLRPLLSHTRADVEFYARSHELKWIEDDSNQQTDFDRNFLRHEIMPALEARREGVIQNMARSAQHIADAAQLVEALAKIDYELVKGAALHQLTISALKELDDNRQRNVIRYWLAHQGKAIRMPTQAILEQIQQQFLEGYPGASPVVQWGRVMLRRDTTRSFLVCTVMT